MGYILITDMGVQMGGGSKEPNQTPTFEIQSTKMDTWV
jgi:hypothetical protein